MRAEDCMQKLPGDPVCDATKQFNTPRLAKSAREPQISRLRAFHNSCGGSTVLYVYGPRSTGKTVTVKCANTFAGQLGVIANESY